jgi:hypothetical protein
MKRLAIQPLFSLPALKSHVPVAAAPKNRIHNRDAHWNTNSESGNFAPRSICRQGQKAVATMGNCFSVQKTPTEIGSEKKFHAWFTVPLQLEIALYLFVIWAKNGKLLEPFWFF